jgi:hypothetical protein
MVRKQSTSSCQDRVKFTILHVTKGFPEGFIVEVTGQPIHGKWLNQSKIIIVFLNTHFLNFGNTNGKT